ncbi:MAG: hypothetical protein ACQEQL_00375 [Pseudomonadota bacterium]
MVTLTYSCLDDRKRINNSWVEAYRQADHTYRIHLINETNGEKKTDFIAESKSYAETKAILENFEQSAAAVYHNSDYDKQRGVKKYPEKMTTIAFNEGPYSAEYFSFLQARYQQKASGDIWMEATLQKDNTYRIDLCSNFTRPQRHDLHMVLSQKDAIKTLREFEKRSATITNARQVKIKKLAEPNHVSKYIDLDQKRKHKPKHFSKFK